MDLHLELELYNSRDSPVLLEQATHRSQKLFNKTIDENEILRATHASSHIFWSFKTGENMFRLHPRVLDALDVMGFYRAARCGYIIIDNHLITALVERWRPETHTFHFPIGEATVTLQDVAIIWGLPIDGQPVICADPGYTIDMWRWYCEVLLGFRPEENELKSKSRLYLSVLSAHLKNVDITDDTDQIIVDQYARGCALLMLGGFMMPDSSRNLVSLLYLQLLENLETAGSYSWASAVLAYLYRELCVTSDGVRKVICGPLSILQIWAWSRICTIQPLNVRDCLIQGSLLGVNGRILGLPPYGARWVQHHSHTHSARHSVRIYRDIFDRMNDGEFEWEPYDMSLPEIESLGGRCLTENWMSECPLINISIVEFHHPNRVLRQFGRKQEIPPLIEHDHNSLHQISRHGRDKCDWTHFHRNWIHYWELRAPVANTVLIQGTFSLGRGYMQWYRRITRLFISPSHYQTTTGYQPADMAARDTMVQCMERLSVSINHAKYEDRQSIENLLHTSREVVSDMNRILTRPPYLVDPPAIVDTQPNTIGASTSRNQRTRHQTDDISASTSKVQRRRTSASQDSS